jgi:dephospho-CoA kinase
MTPMAQWIVLSGKICAGKDSVAEYFQEDFVVISWSSFVRTVFQDVRISVILADGNQEVASADILRQDPSIKEESLEKLIQLTEDTLRARFSKASREVLQYLGSECFPEDFWAECATSASESFLNAGMDVLLTGGRLPVELDYVREFGAKVIRLDVERSTQLARHYKRNGALPSDEILDHVTETAVDDYDFDLRLDNDGDIVDTVNSIKEYLETLRVYGVSCLGDHLVLVADSEWLSAQCPQCGASL